MILTAGAEYSINFRKEQKKWKIFKFISQRKQEIFMFANGVKI